MTFILLFVSEILCLCIFAPQKKKKKNSVYIKTARVFSCPEAVLKWLFDVWQSLFSDLYAALYLLHRVWTYSTNSDCVWIYKYKLCGCGAHKSFLSISYNFLHSLLKDFIPEPNNNFCFETS